MKETRRHRPAAAILAACLATSLTLSGCQVPLSTVQQGQDIIKRVLQAPAGGYLLAGNLMSALRGGDSKQALIDTLKLVKELRLTDAFGKSQAAKPDDQGNFSIPVVPGATTPGKSPIVAPAKGKYTLTQATEKKGAPVKLQVVLANGKVIDIKFDTGNKQLAEYIDAQLNKAYDLGGLSFDPNAGTGSTSNNPLAEIDSDNDGQKDNVDTDDDGDKASDDKDQGKFAYDTQENHDNDGDGVGDVLDSDDDNDGKADALDRDDDGDGTTDEADQDDDGDGLDDATADIAIEDNDHDVDDDGWADEADPDDDGDGTSDVTDTDDDGDGIADATDGDDDGDGIADSGEAADADDDGVADYFDPNDTDAASWEVAADFDWQALYALDDWDFDFVDDAKDTSIDSEWYDFESDDRDADGIPDTYQESGADADADGVPDEWDTDDNNDGTSETGFDDAAWNKDTDSDGIADWEDYDANDDGSVDPEDVNVSIVDDGGQSAAGVDVGGGSTGATGGDSGAGKWTFEDQNCNGSADQTEKPVPGSEACKAQIPAGMDADNDGIVSKDEFEAFNAGDEEPNTATKPADDEESGDDLPEDDAAL